MTQKRAGLGVVGVVEAGQPRGKSLDRRLEVRVEVDELAQPLRQPGKRHRLVAAPVVELLDPAIGEVHGRPTQSANAVSTSPICCRSCILAEPTAGEEEAGRLIARRIRPPSATGKFRAMNGHGPWLAGSSCTQHSSASAGYAASVAVSSSTGSG